MSKEKKEIKPVKPNKVEVDAIINLLTEISNKLDIVVGDILRNR